MSVNYSAESVDLRRKNEKLSSINIEMTELLGCGILAYTIPERKILLFNREGRRMFNVPENKAINLNFDVMSWIVPEDKMVVREASKKLVNPGDHVEFVFHNKDGIDIKDSGSCTHSFTASYQETINGVLFEFKKDIYGDFKYHEVNEICKKGETGIKVYWSRNILHKSYSNKYGERCVTVKVNGVPYSMLEVMFDRINSDDYLYKRNFFKKGSTLFNKETTRLLTKHIMLNRQREIFIKYVDFDGTAIF